MLGHFMVLRQVVRSDLMWLMAGKFSGFHNPKYHIRLQMCKTECQRLGRKYP